VRSLIASPAVGDEQSVPARFCGPTWLEWARSGLAEMVLLESGPGAQVDAERELLAALPAEDLDCLVFPLFREPPSFSESVNRARALGASLPGWGLIQRLAEVWSSTILLKPVPRHGEASTFPAPEIDPLSACIHALLAAEAVAGGMPLGADVHSVRETLVTDGRGLELDKIEGLIFQLGTVATMLDQGTDHLDDHTVALRGWVDVARRLLRWHANVNSRELYLFDAG